MIKKTLTYHDYDDELRTKDFYFSMNQTEFGLLNNRIPGGLENYFAKIQEDRDSSKLLDLLVMFITESYGERSADGSTFIKKDPAGHKLGEWFISSEACDNLLTSLLEDENSIAAFLTGIMPIEIREKAEKSFREAQEQAKQALPEKTA